MKNKSSAFVVNQGVWAIFKYAVLEESRTIYITRALERYYQMIYQESGKEQADWFWWASMRHLMYRTGELKQDNWQKSGEDFEDFWENDLFFVSPAELDRIPPESREKYYFHRLEFITEFTIGFNEDRYYDAMPKYREEYYNVIPSDIRHKFFKIYRHKYNCTREEIEVMLSKGPQDTVVENEKQKTVIYQFSKAAKSKNKNGGEAR